MIGEEATLEDLLKMVIPETLGKITGKTTTYLAN